MSAVALVGTPLKNCRFPKFVSTLSGIEIACSASGDTSSTAIAQPGAPMQDIALENFLAMIREHYGVLLQLDITAQTQNNHVGE
ncbi:MAG: hypothetical protein KDI14_04135 [Halioglobus sp.]|nr:hypothetical protein [Halioglobus sp.]